MQMALDEAHAAAAAGEVPVGAVLVSAQGAVLARTGNQMRALNDPTAHAEIAAIRQACETLGNERLSGCSLYVTLEPCPMCAGAIAEARIAKLFYGAADVKGGAVDNGVALFDQKSCHHKPEVIGGLRESDCAALLKDFFALRRNG
ncbi:nucleoside deaminase [Alphaproteobacteria bacterium]|nr:tRNA-specific adenosine deaminase [Rhodobiaceae bacterium]MDA8624555.1 nucleoside deaminase [Alphaproteobacteria bacterium]RPF94698.1 MAG: nucleoside deaminase [Rhizobiales bacterium TMED162]MDA8643133.1 nucleoside deaminase [Alphaproteobacteria bacterium]MDA8666321.1 nucleoside deaminase [Alphaproteobacteria bacterium]